MQLRELDETTVKYFMENLICFDVALRILNMMKKERKQM